MHGCPRSGFLTSLLLAAALVACGGSGDATDSDDAPPDFSQSSCFWAGPYIQQSDETNFALLDTGAVYWTSSFTLPEGARLHIRGEFAQGRYQSFNAYNADGDATDALNDAQTEADTGSLNPFQAGAERDSQDRAFSIVVVPEEPPEDSSARLANTLYASRPRNGHIEIFYRLYVPVAGSGVTGGVALPEVEVEMADGRRETGTQACATLAADSEVLPKSTTVPSAAEYSLLREQPLRAQGFPAENPAVWHKYFNPEALYACLYFKLCGGQPAATGGIYNNIDNNYVYSYLSREFGQIAVIRGRLPQTRTTLWGDDIAQSSELRYWSLCNYETYSQRVQAQGCLYDEILPHNAAREYVIVTSSAADRPDNAREECGYGWLEWSPLGDGLNHPEDGLLLLRNLLASPEFSGSIQNVDAPGEESAVMGEYLPSIEYSNIESFESLGCGE